MALQIHTPFPCFTRNPRLLPLIRSQSRPNLSVSSQNPAGNGGGADDPAAVPAKKPIESGQGFGSSSSAKKPSSAKKQGSRRERAKIIRRSPVQKPELAAKVDEAKGKEQGRNESAFLLTWLGLGVVILVEGLGLASSGFLPEEWDKLFVKYLFPSFTPTVVLFVAGTVAYGVVKYLQNEKLKDQIYEPDNCDGRATILSFFSRVRPLIVHWHHIYADSSTGSATSEEAFQLFNLFEKHDMFQQLNLKIRSTFSDDYRN